MLVHSKSELWESRREGPIEKKENITKIQTTILTALGLMGTLWILRIIAGF
jgi:hypothetical protein